MSLKNLIWNIRFNDIKRYPLNTYMNKDWAKKHPESLERSVNEEFERKTEGQRVGLIRKYILKKLLKYQITHSKY